MREAIKNFPKQLKFNPVIENSGNLKFTDKFILSGMGGSHLAADLLKIWKPSLNLIIHSDYGLPEISGNFKDCIIVVSSYSGNTEEALDSFEKAIAKNLSVVAISIGGKLLELAQKYKIPYIKMPDTDIEPRSALGFSLTSLLKIMRREDALSEIKRIAEKINIQDLEWKGEDLADKLKNHIPIIYSSAINFPIAYNWKIKFNETGKIPAFCGAIPEINHNEMVGFSREGKTEKLSDRFHFILLKDENDHPRNLFRMDIIKKIYEKEGLPVEVINLTGNDFWEKVFSSLLFADWTACYTAEKYKIDPRKTEIIKKFKEIIKK